MATAAKRSKVSDGSELSPLQNFLQWCDQVSLVLNSKVSVSREGTVAEYGMLATDDIEEGEVLFTIPRAALLHQGTSEVSGLLDKEKSKLESSSGWVPLLLALLYEYTSPRSHWRPYLSLWTDFKSLDHPMFWPKEERGRLLKGTGVPEAVDRDLANIQSEYTKVVLPFIQSHPEWWSTEEHTLELYTQLVAFVMAYSFQEPQEEQDDSDDDEDEVETTPNPPMMVPMADMLNHVANHNANLEFTPDCLKMVCVRPVRRGQEVFNTYGQMANWQLLHMYGFSEQHSSNFNDTADVPAVNLYKAATQGKQSDLERQLKEQQWEVLCQVMGNKTAFVFGKQGCLTDTDLHTALKVLSMNKEELSEFTENEGWEEDEDEDEDQVSRAVSFDGLPEMKSAWKRLIHDAARLTLQSYGNEGVELEEDESKATLNRRHLNALRVRQGQKSILSTLMKVTERS